jgi:hypothetical protein
VQTLPTILTASPGRSATRSQIAAISAIETIAATTAIGNGRTSP